MPSSVAPSKAPKAPSSYRCCPRQYDACRPGGPNAISDILDDCRRENVECLIFARNEDIQEPYEIED